jgi:hypothetical protein
METLLLKKIGGSLYFKLPLSYRHKFDLKPGDVYSILPNGDGTVFKIIRDEELTLKDMSEREQEKTVHAA